MEVLVAVFLVEEDVEVEVIITASKGNNPVKIFKGLIMISMKWTLFRKAIIMNILTFQGLVR